MILAIGEEHVNAPGHAFDERSFLKVRIVFVVIFDIFGVRTPHETDGLMTFEERVHLFSEQRRYIKSAELHYLQYVLCAD